MWQFCIDQQIHVNSQLGVLRSKSSSFITFPIEKSSHEVKDWSLGERLTLVFAQLEGGRGVSTQNKGASQWFGGELKQIWN